MKDPTFHMPAQKNPAPGIVDALVFRSKATLLQVERAVREFPGNDVQRFPFADALTDHPIIGESRTPLWTSGEDAEQILIAGKIHNLRLAIRRLNGVEVAADRVFSFWKQLGRANRLKGYVAGRELREGCLIPNTGGGLCQLSNALYDAALRAGFQIVERHAHTRIIPGSLAVVGRDATVFWNYVDLRFKSTHAFRIEAELTADDLIVRFRSSCSGQRPILPSRTRTTFKKPDRIGDCLTCGTHQCFRHVKADAGKNDFGRTAYLLDEYWPEFDRYITVTKRASDILCIPLDGKRFGKTNYAWSTTGFVTIKQDLVFTLRRSYRSRKLGLQGAIRQRALLAANKGLAQRYASLLAYDVTHVTLMQQLLPYLWHEGHLAGRTFDVLMTALPLTVLQRRLDEAVALHPESHTLDDFRVDGALVEAENEALRHANKIITPHSEIAALYPDKTVLLDWSIPAMELESRRGISAVANLAFPASTVGRKGVYELRSAMNGLNVQLNIIGPILEGNNFWDGLNVEQVPAGEDWLRNASAVVLPAFVEHRPRRMLEAVARGVPVIASTSCGLGHVRGVTEIQPGDVGSLRTEIEKVVSEKPHV
jgi:glycosyltransferase involved in cell wall biosynthesis